jgi:MFS family permease
LYEKKHLEDVLDVGLLIRGARLAKDEDPLDPAVDLDSLEDLSEMEKRAIERQRNVPFWRMPKDLLVVMLTCCLGALTQGWDQQGIAGANLGWPGEFGLDINLDNANNNDIWIFGAVNAITYFSASVVGAYISDPLNEYLFGRRGALFTAGLFSFSSVIGSAYSTTWRELFATRFLLGIGIGAKASIVPIFESEVLPPSRRGRLLISWQVFTATGIFFGAAANIVLRDHWRWQAASGFIPAFPLFFLAFVCTESPRWLIKQRNRYDKAYESLLRLRKIPILAARELCFIHYQIQVERSLFYDRRVPDAEQDDDNGNESGDPFDAQYASSSYPRRFLNLFHYSRNRRASLAAFVVMISQQLSGVNIFAFLAATFFNTANTGESGSLWLSFAFGLSNAVFSVLAYWLIDTKGRRFLLVFSLFGMIWTMLATGLSFNISPDNSARLGVITFWLILYTFFYSPGAGVSCHSCSFRPNWALNLMQVVPFLYSSEVFPNENREVGMSWAVSWNFLGKVLNQQS